MEITVKGKIYNIFDDEEICSQCDHLKEDNYKCAVFKVPIANYLKCKECKALYKIWVTPELRQVQILDTHELLN